MRAPRFSLLLLCLPFVLFLVLSQRSEQKYLTGRVVDDDGPIEGARVRFQGEFLVVRTDKTGRFRLPLRSGNLPRVTAAKDGYFIAGTAASSPHLHLERLPAEDNENYRWVDPSPEPAHAQNCGNCHGAIHEEWSASAHARSVRNRRFLNLYDGRDWHGKKDIGWNLLKEHPDGAGVCTACHAPTVPFHDPAYYDLRRASGTAAQGVHCDYCHKITDAATNNLGRTHGRFGLQLLRPSKRQLFFGPLDDVDRGDDAFSPLYRKSEYCASCHEGTVFGAPVYTTYSEWLESPARREGKQCQTCHQTPTGMLTNLAPGKGGIPRDPLTLSNHRFLDTDLTTMLRRCLQLSVKLEASKESVRIEATVIAEQVGHRVPTGFVDRHLLLVVEALDKDGNLVKPANGPLLPKEAGNLAGQPGRLFAKQLRDFDGNTPVPFWRAQPDVTDTRLHPGQKNRTLFTFRAHVAHVRLRLLYRRFWQETAEAKGWPDNEIIVAERVERIE